MSSGSDALPSWRRAVTDEDARAWAALLRDDNPLHQSAAATEAMGLGAGLVNPGPAGMAYLMTMLLEAFPGGVIRRIKARFIAPVMTPSEVVASGVTERRERVDGGELVHASLELCVREAPVMTANAVLWLPDAPT